MQEARGKDQEHPHGILKGYKEDMKDYSVITYERVWEYRSHINGTGPS